MAVGLTAGFIARAAESASYSASVNPSLPSDFAAQMMGLVVQMSGDLARPTSIVHGGNEQIANLNIPTLPNSGIMLS